MPKFISLQLLCQLPVLVWAAQTWATENSCTKSIEELLSIPQITKTEIDESKLIFGRTRYLEYLGPSSHYSYSEWNLAKRFSRAYGDELNSGQSRLLFAQDMLAEFIQSVLSKQSSDFNSDEVHFMESIAKRMEIEIRNGNLEFVDASEYPALLQKGVPQFAVTGKLAESPLYVEKTQINSLGLEEIFELLLINYSKHQDLNPKINPDKLIRKFMQLAEIKTYKLQDEELQLLSVAMFQVKEGKAAQFSTRRRHYSEQYTENLESISGQQVVVSDSHNAFDLKELLLNEIKKKNENRVSVKGWHFEIKGVSLNSEGAENGERSFQIMAYHDFHSDQYTGLEGIDIRGDILLEFPLKRDVSETKVAWMIDSEKEVVIRHARKVKVDSTQYLGSNVYKNVEVKAISNGVNEYGGASFFIRTTFEVSEEPKYWPTINVVLSKKSIIGDETNRYILANAVSPLNDGKNWERLPDGRIQMDSALHFYDIKTTSPVEIEVDEIRLIENSTNIHRLKATKNLVIKIDGQLTSIKKPIKVNSITDNTGLDVLKNGIKMKMLDNSRIQLRFSGDENLFSGHNLRATLTYPNIEENYGLVIVREQHASQAYDHKTKEWIIDMSLTAYPHNGVQYLDKENSIPGNFITGIHLTDDSPTGTDVLIDARFTVQADFLKDTNP